MTSSDHPATIRIRVPRHLPFHEAMRRVVDMFEFGYVHALMGRHDGDVASGSQAAGLSQRDLFRLLGRQQLVHMSVRPAARPGLSGGPRFAAPRWLPWALVAMLVALTWGCQGELGSGGRAIGPEGVVGIPCEGSAERRVEVCEPLRIAVTEAGDGKVRAGLNEAYSDCVEVFDIADQLCVESGDSEPAACLDALEGRMPCFEMARLAAEATERSQRDQLLDGFEACTEQTHEAVDVCLDSNLQPGDASCDLLAGHEICGELLEAARGADEADKDEILASYETCIGALSRGFSECSVGVCQEVVGGNKVCELLLDAGDRVDGKQRDDLDEDFVACFRGFRQVERECTGG